MQFQKYPILEFDPAKGAIIEPSEVIEPVVKSEYCVICLLGDVVKKIAAKYEAKIIYEDEGVYGTNPIYQFEYNEQSIVFLQPLVGAPVAAAFLDIAIALGCKKFIACGSAGVLDRDILVGSFVVPNSAIRDEGTSYHYIAPSRHIDVDPIAIDAVTSTLDSHSESYQIAGTWTTDAFFRETPSKIALRKSEGCVAVEMEAAALLAVAQFRNVRLGYLLFAGDDVSGEVWDRRSDISRLPVKERMFWLSVEACLKL